MDTLLYLINILLHLDSFLLTFLQTYGLWVYLALFVVIFCETGLIILPFLPGDSLLFAAGSLAAHRSEVLDLSLLFVLLMLASILGNQLNYFIGRWCGTRYLQSKIAWLAHKRHMQKTHEFYDKHGGKTIILARFIPIIRTFAPFVAGAAGMQRLHFTLYNVASALLWIGSLLVAGYYLGSLPFMQEHFSLVIYTIIALSLMPPALTLAWRAYRSW